MALVPGTQLVIDDETPQRVDEDESDYNPGTPAGSQKFGRVVSYHVNAAHHVGGDDTVSHTAGVDRVRGALYPAGFYSRSLLGTDQLWIIAPSGETVTVERDTAGA